VVDDVGRGTTAVGVPARTIVTSMTGLGSEP
jgi:hypothetical protein